MVRAEGLRPLATRTGISIAHLRSLVGGRAVRTTTLEQIAFGLGLELYIGPPRGDTGTPVPAEVTEALGLPRTASVAEAVRRIKRDALASDLRMALHGASELADQVAAAAESLPGIRRQNGRPHQSAPDAAGRASRLET